MNKYIPLNCKTHYSVRQAMSKPKDLKKRIEFIGLKTCGIADYSIVSGAVQFKHAVPNGIIGTEVCDLNGNKTLIYAKNYDGWKRLIKITSFANNTEETCLERHLLDALLTDDLVIIYLYLENNPREGSYYGIDLNSDNYVEMRRMANAKNKKTVMVHSSLYSDPKDVEDFTILLSIAHNMSSDLVLSEFAELFKKKNHILSYDEALEYGYLEEELNNTLELEFGDYKLNKNPMLPKFKDDIDSIALLREICEANLIGRDERYKKQLDYELDVINQYGLADYFLIVQDVINYTNKKHGMCGIRGSGAGSVISFLSGITEVDPIKYELYFERFINPGRMSSTHIQLPDIDIDVPAEAREDVIGYIKEKYGHERVGQILTYQRIKTHAALKAVFRSNNKLTFDEVNQITKLIPEESKVADKLKEQNYSSLLLYAIENSPEEFRQWVYINDEDEIDGEFKNEFNQALRLEGLNSARSKHAAGVIIGQMDLDSVCPMIWDNSNKTLICGMEMNDLEALGCMKLDILGLRLFDKLIEIFGE